MSSTDEVIREADIVFVAVKASVLVRLIGRLTPISDGKTRLFISLVPGVTRERMTAVSGPPPSVTCHTDLPPIYTSHPSHNTETYTSCSSLWCRASLASG